MSEQEDLEQLEVLYGPLAKFSEHKRGETIKFRDIESGRELSGVILWVCTPGPAYAGGEDHPLTYVVDAGQGIPSMVYQTDVLL